MERMEQMTLCYFFLSSSPSSPTMFFSPPHEITHSNHRPGLSQIKYTADRILSVESPDRPQVSIGNHCVSTMMRKKDEKTSNFQKLNQNIMTWWIFFTSLINSTIWHWVYSILTGPKKSPHEPHAADDWKALPQTLCVVLFDTNPSTLHSDFDAFHPTWLKMRIWSNFCLLRMAQLEFTKLSHLQK